MGLESERPSVPDERALDGSPVSASPQDAQVPSAATQSERVRWLVHTLLHHGLGPVLVCPGSRSTPLVQALAEANAQQMLPILDERSAGFVALGLARAGRRPVVVTTSGSAVAHLLPALVEAGESALQLVVVTADRPLAVRGRGAAQAIFQPGLLAPYANCLDLHADTGAGFAGELARMVAAIQPPMTASLHCNVCLGLPLALDPPVPLPPVPQPTARINGLFAAAGQAVPISPPQPGERVLVIFGPAAAADLQAPMEAAWPHVLVAAESSGACRPAPCLSDHDAWLRGHDTWLRDPALRHQLSLDRIVRVGHWPVAKGLQLLLEDAAQSGLTVDAVLPGRPSDPLGQNRLESNLPTLMAFSQWVPIHGGDVDWAKRWRALDSNSDAAAQHALAVWNEQLPAQASHEWQLLPALLACVPENARLLLGNSMPVRDVDAVWQASMDGRPWPEVHVHRGANGIDGTLAAGVGLALADPSRPVWIYLGDSAFLHDAGSLALLARPDLPRAPITVVVADNNGGRIFDYLPAAQVVQPDVHTRFFTLPHSQSLQQVAAGFGLDAVEVCSVDAGRQVLRSAPVSSCRVVIWRIDPSVSKQAHALRQRASLDAARSAVLP